MKKPLTAAEKKSLTRFEGDIQAGLDQSVAGFVKIGTALARIRDAELHRAKYPNFDAYCRDKWGFSRQHAHRLMQAACHPLGDNERQARALLGLSQEEAADVVALAEASGPVSGAKLVTARELIEQATEGKTGDEKAAAVAELVDQAEEKAARTGGSAPRRPSRIAGCKGLIEDIEKRLGWVRKKAAGLTDVADQVERQIGAVQRELDRLAEIIGSSTEEEMQRAA